MSIPTVHGDWCPVREWVCVFTWLHSLSPSVLFFIHFYFFSLENQVKCIIIIVIGRSWRCYPEARAISVLSFFFHSLNLLFRLQIMKKTLCAWASFFSFPFFSVPFVRHCFHSLHYILLFADQAACARFVCTIWWAHASQTKLARTVIKCSRLFVG